MNGDQAVDAVRNGTRVRVHSMCSPDHVMAEGRVIAYTDRPTITIVHDDGTQSSWITDLPIDVERTTWERQ